MPKYNVKIEVQVMNWISREISVEAKDKDEADNLAIEKFYDTYCKDVDYVDVLDVVVEEIE